MRPMLELAADGKEHSITEAQETLADVFGLTAEERKALLPSGRQSMFKNRVAWAKVYLTRAGALEATKRGYFRIADRGRQLLREVPERITIRELMQRSPEFVEFRSPKQTIDSSVTTASEDDEQTPEELLESAYQRFRAELISEVLSRVKKASPVFFERLVVELLLNMGYGGSPKEAGGANGQSGHEGICRNITEDPIGLSAIFLPPKPWEGYFGRSED